MSTETQMQTETLSPETLGPYTMIREIGRGGMSVVHQAVDRRTGKTVALKAHTIPPSLSGGERREVLVRFEREARVIARLSHPGVVAIHEVGEHDGTHFLAMEYLDGETLRDRLGHGRLTPAQAAPILGQLAEALDAVHAAGIVHRDIKPSNVMLLPDGRVKLLDFGVARQSEDTTVTASHSIVGSPTYMAPEQVQGDIGGPAADIWALGILLYETLSGHPPFEGSSIPSVLYKVAHETPALVPHVSSRVQQVVRRALEKDPSSRYPSPHALADAFQMSVLPTRAFAERRRLRRGGPWAALLAAAVMGIVVGAQHDRRKPPLRTDAVLLPSSRPSPPVLPDVATSAVVSPKPTRIARRPRVHRRRHASPPAPRQMTRRRSSPQSTHENTGFAHQNVRDFRPAVTPKFARHPPARDRSMSPRRSMPAAAGLRRDEVRRRNMEARPYAEALRPYGEPSVPQAPLRATPPVSGPLPTHEDHTSDPDKLQKLEKFIWSEGR